MQHRYAGDIGDYLKLGILRGLSKGRRIGVAWWLHPDQGAAGDGRHTQYLQDAEAWRGYDPQLFDHLRAIVRADKRAVIELEHKSLLTGAVFHSEPVPVDCVPLMRPAARQTWFEKLKLKTEPCDLIFLDPDNGLEPNSYKITRKNSGKSVRWQEIVDLRRSGRCIVVYHHQTRFKGGHLAELSYLGAQLRAKGFRTVDVLRARPYSPRAFFLLGADSEMRCRAQELSERWNGCISRHPDIK